MEKNSNGIKWRNQQFRFISQLISKSECIGPDIQLGWRLLSMTLCSNLEVFKYASDSICNLFSSLPVFPYVRSGTTSGLTSANNTIAASYMRLHMPLSAAAVETLTPKPRTVCEIHVRPPTAPALLGLLIKSNPTTEY